MDKESEKRKNKPPLPKKRLKAVFKWSCIIGFLFIIYHLLLASLTNERLTAQMGSTSSNGVSLKQQAQLQEIADLMLQIYQTLAAMRFIPASSIIPGPHDIDLKLAEECELDPLVIHLHQNLPYIDKEKSEMQDFIFGGEFADFRDAGDVEQSRDPFYAGWKEYNDGKGKWDEEGGEYIRPWVTPLSMMGNHQAVILYDARQHRIWIIDQEGWSTSDPALSNSNRGWVESTSKNGMNFDHIPSRPAPEVLKDIIKWYRTLEIIPGGSEHSDGSWDYESLKELYLKHGWPDAFDGDAFEIDDLRRIALDRATYFAEEPLRKVETYRNWNQYSKAQTARLKDQLAAATTSDAQWTVKLQLWLDEVRVARLEKDRLAAAETAEQLCPRGVCMPPSTAPIWERENLRIQAHLARGNIEHSRLNNYIKEDELTDDIRRYYVREGEKAKVEFAKLKLAFQASSADAARLCPDETEEIRREIAKRLKGSDSQTRMGDTRRSIAEQQRLVDDLTAWAALVPEEAVEAKGKVEVQISDFKAGVGDMEERLSREEAWYAEHGDGDDDEHDWELES